MNVNVKRKLMISLHAPDVSVSVYKVLTNEVSYDRGIPFIFA